MLNKNILFLTAFLSFGILYADNPGEDMMSSADVAETATDTAAPASEEVVAETPVVAASSSSNRR